MMNEEKIINHYLQMYPEGLKDITIGLMGDLGAGKTYFVKKLLEKLSEQFNNQVSSPTYNICNIYESDLLIVHHYDLYRLESNEELYQIDIWESLENKNILTMIEWADKFKEILKNCQELLKLSLIDKQTNYEQTIFKE